ncbi:ester cyclase [Nocardioides taihuensis]|uniref:Ester cyclase n=1 Tax=Nocardioides taihuensis TaxID=1835606 RepID=A0ABW0BE86_9ACTN
MNSTEIAAALFAAYNAGDLDAVERLYSKDAAHLEVNSGRSKQGPQTIRDGMKFFLTAFPDAHWRVVDLIADEERAAVTYVLTGTLAVRLGPFAPNGQRLSLDGVMVLHTEAASISKSADYWDSETFGRQMAVDAPAEHDSDGAQLVGSGD